MTMDGSNVAEPVICQRCLRPEHGSLACALDPGLDRLLYGDGVTRPAGIFTTSAAAPTRKFDLEDLDAMRKEFDVASLGLVARAAVRSRGEVERLRRKLRPADTLPLTLTGGPGLFGFPLVVDETVPPGVLEMRNAHGSVVARVDVGAAASPSVVGAGSASFPAALVVVLRAPLDFFGGFGVAGVSGFAVGAGRFVSPNQRMPFFGVPSASEVASALSEFQRFPSW